MQLTSINSSLRVSGQLAPRRWYVSIGPTSPRTRSVCKCRKRSTPLISPAGNLSIDGRGAINGSYYRRGVHDCVLIYSVLDSIVLADGSLWLKESAPYLTYWVNSRFYHC